MLGWLISVHLCGTRVLREARGDADALRSLLLETTGSGNVPASTDADERIAIWQTGPCGLDWLERLVSTGRALSTSHGGYPENYLVLCRDFMALLDDGLPDERPLWRSDPGDTVTDRWLGRTTIDGDALARCDPDAWLLVEAWDES